MLAGAALGLVAARLLPAPRRPPAPAARHWRAYGPPAYLGSVVRLDGELDAGVGLRVAAELGARAAVGVRPVLAVDSVGGFLDEAFVLTQEIGELARRGIPVRCVAEHQAYSAALAVLESCPEREIVAGSSLMLHHASRVAPVRVYPDGPRGYGDALAAVRAQDARLLRATLRRTRVPMAVALRRIRGQGQWYLGSAAAVRLGFADRVVEGVR